MLDDNTAPQNSITRSPHPASRQPGQAIASKALFGSNTTLQKTTPRHLQAKGVVVVAFNNIALSIHDGSCAA